MRRRATTRIALIIASLMAIGGVAVAIGGLASASIPRAAAPVLTDAAISPAVPDSQTAVNRRAAFADAHKLIGELRLPAGAGRVGHEPRGDGGWLAHPGSAPGTGALADVHRWWVLRGTVGSVIADLKDLRPVGASGGQLFGAFSGPGHSGRVIEFEWQPTAGVLSSRAVVIEAVNLRDGMTGVRADAEDVWIVARPAAERLPAGINEIVVSSAFHGKPPFLSLTVTDPSKIDAIVSLLDGLPVAQPVVYACPLIPTGLPTVTMVFYGGAELAQATVQDDDGAPSWACSGEIDLTLGGVAQMPLTGNFIAPVQQLLGVNFDPGGSAMP